MRGNYSFFLLLSSVQFSYLLSLDCPESPYQTNSETTSNDINRLLALWSKINVSEFCHAEINFMVGGAYNLTDCYYFGINADTEYAHATLTLDASQAADKVVLVAAPSLGHFSVFMESEFSATNIWFQVSTNISSIPLIPSHIFVFFLFSILIQRPSIPPKITCFTYVDIFFLFFPFHSRASKIQATHPTPTTPLLRVVLQYGDPPE